MLPTKIVEVVVAKKSYHKNTAMLLYIRWIYKGFKAFQRDISKVSVTQKAAKFRNAKFGGHKKGAMNSEL